MKLRLLISALVVASGFSPLAALSAFAASLPAPSRITAVTVYADRAVVTRSARVELPAGQTELSFENLPASLVDQSLQVAGRGATGATILDVGTRTVFVEAAADPRVKALEHDLREQQKTLRVLNDRGAVINHQWELVAKIEGAVAAPPAKDATPTRPGFEEWQKLMAFSEETRGKLASAQQTLDQQKEDQQAKIFAIEAQLDALRGRGVGGRSSKTVTVRVAADAAGPVELAVAYAVPGASWTPSYDARLRGEERTVELNYFGTVIQNTGEDWKDVALTLSTARPSLGGGAPELATWWVDALEYKRARRPEPSATVLGQMGGMDSAVFNRAAPAALSEGATGGGMVAEALTAGLSDASATVTSAATSASFKIATAATVLSDNSPQKVGIATAKLAATLQYQSTPRLLEAAFLGAYVTNLGDYPLLAGAVNTFLDDTFVATAALKSVMPGEKFELALGADERIAIKRKVVNRFSEDTGLTNGGRRVTYDFLVTLTNNKKTAERVVFKELLPVSRSEKIVVKLLTPAERELGTADKPKEVSREADGRLVWRLDLKPGEKREVGLKFSVENPADVQALGLE